MLRKFKKPNKYSFLLPTVQMHKYLYYVFITTANNQNLTNKLASAKIFTFSAILRLTFSCKFKLHVLYFVCSFSQNYQLDVYRQ